MLKETNGEHEKEIGKATTEEPKKCGSDFPVALGAIACNYGLPVRGKDEKLVAHNVAAPEEVVCTVRHIESTNLEAEEAL